MYSAHWIRGVARWPSDRLPGRRIMGVVAGRPPHASRGVWLEDGQEALRRRVGHPTTRLSTSGCAGAGSRDSGDRWTRRTTCRSTSRGDRRACGRRSTSRRSRCCQRRAACASRGWPKCAPRQADGRWDAAYASQKRATVPAEVIAALADNTPARDVFDALDKTAQYLLYLPVLQARTEKTRAARVEKLVSLLEAGRIE